MGIPFTEFMIANLAGDPIPAGQVCFSYGAKKFFISEVTSSAVRYGVNGYSISATGYVILGVSVHRRVLGSQCVIEIDDEDLFP